MRKLATVRVVKEIQPIAGADLIELAVVDGWKCVIKKNEYTQGDLVIYCEIDSFLPIRPEFEFLRKSSFKKMEHKEGFRLRTVKLRGQISQGLLINPTILDRPFEIGEDVTEELGIEKYEPPIPACLGGDVVGSFPGFLSKTDEERIQNLASEYAGFKGKTFYVSEKIDGTSFTAFFHQNEFGVCGRNWQLAESQKNSHWRIANALGLREKIHNLGRSFAIQGELVGPGIQGNRYGLAKPMVYVFNIFDIGEGSYLPKPEMEKICQTLELPICPLIGELEVPDSIEAILDLSEGKSALNEKTEREGLVWVSGFGQDRISFKTISNKFLAKYGE